ncbi:MULTISPECIES: hypothetical protein [Methylomonas]|uniref:hypothetical protein n=1 Tax=Methylomonas TaxID=416 RepID=UPI0012F6BA46|nr:hypothetical protein [Methylomonas koyamae]
MDAVDTRRAPLLRAVRGLREARGQPGRVSVGDLYDIGTAPKDALKRLNMSNQWFRLYGEILSNTKVIALPEALRWRYVALLCLHCNGDYENTPDDEISLALRISNDEWQETRSALIKRRLLADDGKILGWEKRQYISDLKDPTAPERMKRYRNKKRNERNEPVTLRPPEAEPEADKKKDKSFLPREPKKTEICILLSEFGIDENLANDFQIHRKKCGKDGKEAPITRTAMEGYKREAEAAGITTADAVRESIENGWRGFKADWHFNLKAKSPSPAANNTPPSGYKVVGAPA